MSSADASSSLSEKKLKESLFLKHLLVTKNCRSRHPSLSWRWLDSTCVSMATDVEGFVNQLQDILDGAVDKTKEAYQVAESRTIEKVAQQLADAYQQTLEL